MRLNYNLVEQYIHDIFVPSDSELETVFNTANLKKGMQISPIEGRLLQFLINLSNAKKIVEVGTFIGYSTLWMIKSIIPDGHIYSIEKQKEHFMVAEHNLKKWQNFVTLLHGSALEILPSLVNYSPFDMIFIDADKVSYPLYLDWAEKYVKKGGLVVADNTLLFNTIHVSSNKLNWIAMRQFNKRLGDDTKFCGTLLPTTEGLTAAIKKF